MSQENVDLNYRSHDAFNRRDLEGYLALNDPGVEFTPYERAVEGLGPYRGHEGVRSWWDETLKILPDLRVELDEVRDLGDLTLVRGRLWGHGAGSGASFERTYWGVFHWHDKKVVWWHAFQSEAQALEAARLQE
jgi:ketosteroid isomerase-like protein